MATCKVCKHDMLTVRGCRAARLQFTPKLGKPVMFDKIKYGDGSRYAGSERCHDCNVALGQYHHPGCDWEECPRCHGQAIGCSCNDEGTWADVFVTRRKAKA